MLGYSQEKEQPLEPSQLDDDARNERTASCADGGHRSEQSKPYVPLHSWWKGDTQKSHNVRNHESTADATQGPKDTHGNQIDRVSTGQGPYNPPCAASSEDVLVAIHSTQTATCSKAQDD